LLSSAIVASFLLAGSGAFALSAPGSSGASRAKASARDTRYKQKTILDFEEDVVEGRHLAPDGTWIGGRPTAKTSSLIKPRVSFLPEMLKSVDDL